MRLLLLLPAPLFLLLAGCGTLHARDVAAAFATEAGSLVDRGPMKADMDPARAANAPGVMQETERLAREYLKAHERPPPPPDWKPSAPEAYVRALLACALLAQGRPAHARDALRWTDAAGTPRAMKARQEIELTRENAVAAGAVHAAATCRSVEARMAAERFLARELTAEAFVREYGSFAGLPLAAPDAADHEKMVKLAATGLESSCAPGAEPGAAAAKARAELRRTLAEQVSNDAASLVARLPPPPEGARAAELAWLARVAVKGVTVYRYLIPDMLPVPLSAEQKQWQREQALPLFDNARDLAGWFLTSEARKRIEQTRQPKTPDEIVYDRLISAQTEVFAWIDRR